MSGKQKEINSLVDGIKFYESELLKTTKQVAVSDAEFAAMTPEQQAACPSGYGVRFKTVAITDDDRKNWQTMLAHLRGRLNQLG